ncbi:ubiquinone biosynthesis protein UbiB [Hymenobacter qilianensis]|uniref:Ubiquinone biosynthesis protein UbiB n=2 Tax=Hymenobacter qilianensis TaxID=1385715 RepID=A0ACB5PW48_9BACT|nr:AarF/ABC1/UbiB kinase family protein [Hymenobacter qilianensis]QNP51142.1 AarF/ABC1/UbiB kinase family protein [Hymenobacter qilianensis]GGF77966.1 ubiquinone biosynthesis protein UbiB [Hymenobacter qilianensis]
MFKNTISNLGRIRQVMEVLVRYGFEDVVTSTALRRLVPQGRRVSWQHAEKTVFDTNRWQRIRLIIEELGPTFIKLAQALSNRPDLLPEALIDEFEKLQSDVPPFPVVTARRLIEEELGRPISEVFSEFDDTTLGSASIGQVHRARLLTGEEVVVKVQRPGVQEKVRTDLSLLRELVRLTAGFLRKQGLSNPQDIVDAFERSMTKELDYTSEARSMDQFRKLYEDYETFYVPKPYREFSTSKILVIEFVSGCKISNKPQLLEWGLDPAKVAETGMDIYLTQIFEFGVFHADPHPGNVLVRPDGTIVLIDFGMVGKLTKQQKYAFAGVFIGMARQDARSMALNFRRLALHAEIPDMRRFEADLNELIEDFTVLDVKEMSMSDLADRLQVIIYDYKLQVPGAVFLILRALVILEGIGKVLHPSFNTFEFVRPYGARIIAEQYSPENLMSEAQYTGVQLLSLLSTLPTDVRQIMRKISRGDLRVKVELGGYQSLLRKADQLVSRTIIALLAVAFLLFSGLSLMGRYSAEMAYHRGIPMLTWFGLGVTGFLLLVLVIMGLRKPRD